MTAGGYGDDAMWSDHAARRSGFLPGTAAAASDHEDAPG